jgi:hypothetical protein
MVEKAKFDGAKIDKPGRDVNSNQNYVEGDQENVNNESSNLAQGQQHAT